MLVMVLAGLGLWVLMARAREGDMPTPEAILQELRTFREMGSVLYVAAHPDDENTLLIAYLARGRNYRTAYLSLTRGDGGQNVLGPEFGAKLGVARTQELLAARRLDGGRQFFTRAVDFGYSKDYQQTLRIWDREQVLSDVVRVIRTFRPDVVITRFAPWPTGTHGHHTASAVLAVEAFKEAGDASKFPEQLTELTPWQPKRILMDGREDATNATVAKMEISGRDPVLRFTFGDLAARGRAMHRTQGFANFRGSGSDPHTETFQLLAGVAPTNDIMDGIDITWNRVPGGEDIGILTDAIIAQFDLQDPGSSVPELLKLRRRLLALNSHDPVVAEKAALLDQILQACLGLEIRSGIEETEVVPGQTLKLKNTVELHSDVPVRWVGMRYPSLKQEVSESIALVAEEPVFCDASEVLPTNTPLSQPYWLREEGTAGMFRVEDASLIGQPENPPVLPVEFVFELEDQKLVLPTEPLQVTTNTATAKKFRHLEVIAPVLLRLDSEVALFNPGTAHQVRVGISATRADQQGKMRLEAPADWSISPTNQAFALAKIGDWAHLEFTITAPAKAETAKIIADAEIGGVHYENERAIINYRHIPRQLLQPRAVIQALSLDLQVRAKNIGYLPGAGDDIPAALQEMGCTVTMLDDTNLTAATLHPLDAVVIGVRAYNVRAQLATNLPRLFEYVRNGGTVIAQYNRPEGLKADSIAPYSLHVSGDRVTDAAAPMTLLAPNHPVLNTPNKITAADFDGWVQERGIYFPNQWDDHFTAILACNDPGEAPRKGCLLVAQYGKGFFVYTGLDFFRELPAGVPGAYRLFANLLSLGK